MALFGSSDKHPNYDPVAVSELLAREEDKKEKLLKLIRKYRRAKDQIAVRLYKEIKLSLSML